MRKTRFLLALVLAWLVFLTLDFLAHASLLSSLWVKDYPALRSEQDLFRLIPFGYLSFFLIVLLVGWVYSLIHGLDGDGRKGLEFGAKFGGLVAGSIFLGWYSFLNLPILFLALISLVYFVEISAAGFVFGHLLHLPSVKKRAWALVLFVFLGLVLGIILQNLFSVNDVS